MQTFLVTLREKLSGLASRLRAFSLRLIGRTPAGRETGEEAVGLPLADSAGSAGADVAVDASPLEAEAGPSAPEVATAEAEPSGQVQSRPIPTLVEAALPHNFSDTEHMPETEAVVSALELAVAEAGRSEQVQPEPIPPPVEAAATADSSGATEVVPAEAEPPEQGQPEPTAMSVEAAVVPHSSDKGPHLDAESGPTAAEVTPAEAERSEQVQSDPTTTSLEAASAPGSRERGGIWPPPSGDLAEPPALARCGVTVRNVVAEQSSSEMVIADAVGSSAGEGLERSPVVGSTDAASMETSPVEAPRESSAEEQDLGSEYTGEDLDDAGGALDDSDDSGKPVRDSHGVTLPARHRADRRRRLDLEELSRPAVLSASPLDDAGYLAWNRAIAKHCLFDADADGVLYLTITPTILAAALSEVHPGRLLPEDAEAAFAGAIAAVYRSRVLNDRQHLRLLRRCGAQGLPECVGFLAASVLAAYRMRSDEETAASAYYARLAEILECDLVAGHPRGFDPIEFEALWRFLEAWLRAEKGRRLALPPADAGVRRFVALPLTHVPLRRVDIERLPDFFAWAGYEPGVRIPRDGLDQDLASWSLGRSPFTNAGMAALADERRDAVLAQVAHELESWDGSQTDSLGRRSGRVEILLDVVQRRPELFYLPRRPAGFPQVFDDGMHAFEASDDGWYDPVALGADDGEALSEGLEWQVIAGRLRLVLRRPGARAIALPAHQYTGFLSHRALKLGAPAAALCREELSQVAADYLSAISQQRCLALNHPGLPKGWRLFTGIKPRRRGEVPPSGLEALAIEAAVELIPSGGLRLGSRWTWLAGAPPRLLVVGLADGECVSIDGESVAVADDGTLAGNGALTTPGNHVVEAGSLRRSIAIAEPEAASLPQAFAPTRLAIALPRGSWTLLGAVPGEIVVPRRCSSAGSIAACGFEAVWAVEVGAGPGARVLCLSTAPRGPGNVTRLAYDGPIGRSLQAWASTIYNAAIRRPRIIRIGQQDCQQPERVVWAKYTEAARQIKRRLRKARR